MNNIMYEKALLQYAPSYCKAVDIVARERKYLGNTTGFPEESTIEFVKSIVHNNLSQFYAILNDRVIGWCDVLPKNYEGFTHVGILGMGVVKEYRHQGIGRKLLHMAMDHARTYNNIEKIELEVYKTNSHAIELYTKEGFLVEGERIKARKLDGNYDNLVLMGKQL